MFKEISINDLNKIKIGQVENVDAATGCTVIISENEFAAGVDVRGGGPASRDTQLLNPLMAAEKINAVLLSGGSAFGLGAANGVMKYLEERDIGFDVGVTKVPLVVQSDIFDLTVGDTFTRPDEKMGYEAARCAFEGQEFKDGNYGAGCGATVGKIRGMDYCMKTGIGSYAVQIDELQIGAIVVVNALGDIFDSEGRQIAGLLSEDKKALGSTMDYMKSNINVRKNKFTGNTTIGIVITNADFTKSQLCKISGMAQDGMARAISPVHTTADGDTIYSVSTGEVSADMDIVGALAADVFSEAIVRAVKSADGAYGFPSARDL